MTNNTEINKVITHSEDLIELIQSDESFCQYLIESTINTRETDKEIYNHENTLEWFERALSSDLFFVVMGNRLKHSIDPSTLTRVVFEESATEVSYIVAHWFVEKYKNKIILELI